MRVKQLLTLPLGGQKYPVLIDCVQMDTSARIPTGMEGTVNDMKTNVL